MVSLSAFCSSAIAAFNLCRLSKRPLKCCIVFGAEKKTPKKERGKEKKIAKRMFYEALMPTHPSFSTGKAIR